MMSAYNLLWIVPVSMMIGAAIWTLIVLNASEW